MMGVVNRRRGYSLYTVDVIEDGGIGGVAYRKRCG